MREVIAALDHWLYPMFDQPVWLDFDPDCINALTDKRQAQRSKIQHANFLTRNEQREAAGYAHEQDGAKSFDNNHGY